MLIPSLHRDSAPNDHGKRWQKIAVHIISTVWYETFFVLTSLVNHWVNHAELKLSVAKVPLPHPRLQAPSFGSTGGSGAVGSLGAQGFLPRR